MIGGLLLFLGSAGYLTYKAASSASAKQDVRIHTKNTGINLQRQMQLEIMGVGSTPVNREQFVRLLREADLSKTTMRDFHESKREYLLEEYAKFEPYSKALRSIRCFDDIIKQEDKNYAVWMIAQSEGWTYNKSMLHGLPSFCYGYEAHNDPYLKNRARKI